jgi:hypothetical protein
LEYIGKNKKVEFLVKYFIEYNFLSASITWLVKNKLFFLLAFMLLQLSCKKDSYVNPAITSFLPEKGSYNNRVYIRGVHFDSSIAKVKVTFNGSTAIVTSVSDTLIAAVVPENAGTGKIGVSVDGRTAISVNDFVIIKGGKWIRKAEKQPGYLGRALVAGFSIGSKGYLFGGADGGITQKDFWEYDLAANRWTEKANPGVYMENGISMVINGKAYIGIGSSRISNTDLLEFWEYNPANDVWTRKADFPGVPRRGAVGFSMGNKGYTGLGAGTVGTGLKDWWQYDPATDKWSRKTDYSLDADVSYYSIGGFVINDKIFVVSTGLSGSKAMLEYSWANDVWVKKADFPGKFLLGPSSFTLGSKGYLAGGGDECWEYNPVTNSWTQKPFFDNRSFGAAFSIDNKGYYTSGTNGQFQQDIWEYDPSQ